MPAPKLYSCRGERLTLRELAAKTGVNFHTLRGRINNYGFTVEGAVDHPGGPRRSDTAARFLFRDQRLTVKEIAAVLGIGQTTVRNRRIGDRIAEGAELKDPYREPPNAVLLFFRGERMCIAAWARRIGMNPITLRARLRMGWSLERALTAPVGRTGRNSIRHRNNVVLRRIANAFKAETSKSKTSMTGGRSKTFTNSLGTGVGTSKTDFERERP